MPRQALRDHARNGAGSEAEWKVYRRVSCVLVLMLPATLLGQSSSATRRAANPPAPPAHRFGFESVQRLAEQRAAEPYRSRDDTLPPSLARLGYPQYQQIRFRPERARWRGEALFEVQFFQRGAIFDKRVSVTEVADDGSLHPIRYDPSAFEFPGGAAPKDLPGDLGFAGLRVQFPLNRGDYKDELISFLGTSSFRLLGREQSYGAFARGLAVNVAAAAAEELPYFTDFWLVHPSPEQRTLRIYALLDSPSVTGAYRFEIRPDAISAAEVTATLYARSSMQKPGLAPLTSMFFYGKEGVRPVDDYRPEVHDSDGLQIEAGDGEWLWRPLSNPRGLRISSFYVEHPRGFGLLQRERDFGRYQDEEAHYQRRPSYWITPLGDWGKGIVELVETPSGDSARENIIAFWVPRVRPEPHRPYTYSYLLSAYLHSPSWPPGGRVISTRSAPVSDRVGARRILIDFTGGDLDSLQASEPIRAEIDARRGGTINDVSVQRLAENGVWRVSFQVAAKGAQATDLRCYLSLYGEALTETWSAPWTP